MPLAEAKSILYRSSQTQPFHIFPYDPAADLYAIEKLADELDQFSPIVGLQQDREHPDCIFLDITGLAPLFDGEFKLACGVKYFCNDAGYLVEIAIANTIGAAQAIAQFGVPSGIEPENSRSISILHQEEKLEALPVHALRLKGWITETLEQLGIQTIGQLLKLPRASLSARFGKEIHQRLDQLNGKLAEPIIARNSPAKFHAEQLLDYPTSDYETIQIITERLIEKLCKQLAAVQQGALQWTIRLYGQYKLPLKLCISLFEPTSVAQHVMQLALMQLEQTLMTGTAHPSVKSKTRSRKTRTRLQINREPLQVNEITVSVTSCVLLVQKQRQLFDENPRLDQQELAHLINRLSGRLGRKQVLYPTIVSGAQPEHAYQFRPLVDPHRKRARRIVATPMTESSHRISRPLRILQPAIPLQMRCHHDNDPLDARLEIDGQTHTVTQRWGPERIETGWWRGRKLQRDYWRAETQTYQQFWLYHDLRKREWFLQGEF